MPFTYPPSLRAGDLVAVVAPSSPFDSGLFWRGLAWLRDRYELLIEDDVLARDGYLAGDDARRTREMARAMTHPEVRAIVAARGGYGATRIVQALPWDAFARAPKWICGFSDVTAFHVILAARRIASVHGPHVTSLATRTTPVSLVHHRAAWLAAMERPRASRTWRDLEVLHSGRASGPLVGGNLALVEAMAAGGQLALPNGAILALEDVTERPYRLDRMLTALRASGQLARLSGIVFGEFSQCDPGVDGVRARDVFFERTRDLGIPVVLGAPFGHGDRNDAFVLGASAQIEDARVELGVNAG